MQIKHVRRFPLHKDRTMSFLRDLTDVSDVHAQITCKVDAKTLNFAKSQLAVRSCRRHRRPRPTDNGSNATPKVDFASRGSSGLKLPPSGDVFYFYFSTFFINAPQFYYLQASSVFLFIVIALNAGISFFISLLFYTLILFASVLKCFDPISTMLFRKVL